MTEPIDRPKKAANVIKELVDSIRYLDRAEAGGLECGRTARISSALDEARTAFWDFLEHACPVDVLCDEIDGAERPMEADARGHYCERYNTAVVSLLEKEPFDAGLDPEFVEAWHRLGWPCWGDDFKIGDVVGEHGQDHLAVSEGNGSSTTVVACAVCGRPLVMRGGGAWGLPDAWSDPYNDGGKQVCLEHLSDRRKSEIDYENRFK